MKSQDILLLLKLVSLHGSHKKPFKKSQIVDFNAEWKQWKVSELTPDYIEIDSSKSLFSVRGLANQTGISKSQASLSLNRCIDIGLAKLDRKTLLPKANAKALMEFIVYGIRYVFPVKAGEVTRGIATSFAAPIFKDKLISLAELPPVWSDVKGNIKGVAIEPLHKNIRQAVNNDIVLYALLALTDAIRLGKPRERNLAIDKLSLLVTELQ